MPRRSQARNNELLGLMHADETGLSMFGLAIGLDKVRVPTRHRRGSLGYREALRR